MQWNTLDLVREPSLFGGLERPLWVYFVHSYAAEPSADVVATCEYGGSVVAAVRRGALWALQFHPEKSGTTGLGLLANFVTGL
jgi:glutamine amidotransferase